MKKEVKDEMEVASLSITRASNGFSVVKHLQSKAGKGMPVWADPETAVFKNMAEMLEYVRHCFVGPSRK